ncbi:hypothetical protein NUH86_10985 [Sphingobium sp. JS3065]|uniref:hypothetical protein n=1 Tax=Sphingobium sp. JS3065 TaxID=2970925 RepID=UPI002264408F|nr:hypothetical protein [Sphingobium sp. JS3065]UZW54059.1 hypothetical protein NUH86_10985 [Sphingobium sp. JS3065]
MANPLRGEVAITIAETRYLLVFDVNAFCHAQDALGKKPLEMVADFSADPDDLVTLRGLFWAGLQKHHACHLLAAGELLSDAGQPAVRAALADGLAAAFGLAEKQEGKEGENPPTTTPGTGSGSTGNTAKPVATARSSGRKPRG